MQLTIQKLAPIQSFPNAEYTVEKYDGGFITTFDGTCRIDGAFDPLDTIGVTDGDGNALRGVVQSVSRVLKDGALTAVVDAKLIA
ncbi:hypothetical protein [Paraburkholderia bryophila]|uniref:Uncharacterized protein n=1 Tax=Paraburkholderia bryophila TaxID=420952 RepID=A0A7Y9WQ82_9BURK|nr:hypothetical protein [Paraburkholderia bryophila]NYH24692.1 hypothetical protein [Paraburkholderia bryophila]